MIHSNNNIITGAFRAQSGREGSSVFIVYKALVPTGPIGVILCAFASFAPSRPLSLGERVRETNKSSA
jgi:hypothetical protein